MNVTAATQNQARNRAQGFSLLELLLVVAVGAVLILAGLGAYRLVSENNNTNQAVRMLTTLKQQVQQAYQGQSTYGAAANDNLIDDLIALRALPSDLGVNAAGNAAKGPFGDITIVGNADEFALGFANVPKGACIRLAQQFTPQNANDFVGLTIGSTGTYDQASTNMTQTEFTTSCSDESNNNTMTWTFH